MIIGKTRNNLIYRVKEGRNIVRAVKRRKAKWIDHMLCIKCLLKYVIEGKIEGRVEVKARRGRRRKQLLDDLKEKRMMEIERGRSRSHSVKNSFWKRLWTCLKTDYRMNE
jgi:hypothetical protein